MASITQTVRSICDAPTLDARIAEMRKVPGRHGSDDWAKIYAEVAREAYVPALTPDYAYIHVEEFYSEQHFHDAYDAASSETSGFTVVDHGTLVQTLKKDPRSLLAFRVMAGFTRDEFAHSVKMAVPDIRLSGGSVDNHERKGSAMDDDRADAIAKTLLLLMNGQLFGATPSADVMTKQAIKSDTRNGWASAANFATNGVPYWMLLHQRHYGGAFRTLLDATSTNRGDLIEDAVEDMFETNKVPYIRTGSHNQGDIAARFGLEVRPAPDFVLFDESSDTLMAILECKGANDGGTARDKALRFNKLRAESQRLGGVPVMAVLGGIGWRRVNDTLGPVLADTDGRVFTLSTLHDMLTVAPLTTLAGTASQP